jgi:hypothetical protein
MSTNTSREVISSSGGSSSGGSGSSPAAASSGAAEQQEQKRLPMSGGGCSRGNCVCLRVPFLLTQKSPGFVHLPKRSWRWRWTAADNFVHQKSWWDLLRHCKAAREGRGSA